MCRRISSSFALPSWSVTTGSRVRSYRNLRLQRKQTSSKDTTLLLLLSSSGGTLQCNVLHFNYSAQKYKINTALFQIKFPFYKPLVSMISTFQSRTDHWIHNEWLKNVQFAQSFKLLNARHNFFHVVQYCTCLLFSSKTTKIEHFLFLYFLLHRLSQMQAIWTYMNAWTEMKWYIKTCFYTVKIWRCCTDSLNA